MKASASHSLLFCRPAGIGGRTCFQGINYQNGKKDSIFVINFTPPYFFTLKSFATHRGRATDCLEKSLRGKLALTGTIDLSELAINQYGGVRIVLDSLQDMLIKVALQTARDDY